MYTSSRKDYWSPASRALSLPYAQALLPSLIVGYLIPTILIYLPYENVFVTQGYAALWQPVPIYVNTLLFVLAQIYSIGQSKSKTTSPETEKNTDDVKYLKRVCVFSFIVGALTHWAAVAICFFSSDPNLSFMHAFWPNKEFFLGQVTGIKLSQGLLYIYQVDFWIIFASWLIWTSLVILDTNRATSKSFMPPVKALAVMALDTILFGPAATIAATWHSREGTLAQIQKSKAI